MELRNAIIFHILLLTAQPAYHVYKYTHHANYLSTLSTTNITLSLGFWLLVLTRFTIPVFTSPLRHLPSPKGDVFPIGHSRLLLHQMPPTKLVQIVAETPNEGVIAFWDPFYLRIRTLMTNPETTMDLLNARSYDWEKPPPSKRLLRNVLGDGLINVEGNVHKAMRKTVAAAFTGKHIRDLVPLFYSKGLAFADALKRELRTAERGELEIMEQMSRVTLDIIGTAGIGMDFDTINSDENQLARLYAIITSTNRGPILLFFLINSMLPRWLIKKLYGTVHSRVAYATEELRTNIMELLREKKYNMKLNSAGHTDIIATIMRTGDFSDEYLCNQLLTFFAAGHDTTAGALTWTAWLLALHPHVQHRLRKDCLEHLSSASFDSVDADIFDEIPYLNAICNETLRFYPTVPTTARHAIVDTKVANVFLPKGTTTLVSPWVMNRDPSLWGSDADKWNPDRWMNESSSAFVASGNARSPYAFLTFLHGPRSCIGQAFAKTEMKCLLAALVLRFEFLLPEQRGEVQLGGFVTLKPKGGLWLKLRDLELDAEKRS